MRIALLPLARPTFDMGYAAEKLAAMLGVLDASGHELEGSRDLLTGDADSAAALGAVAAAAPDLVLVLQVTFTDAAFLGAVAERLDAPIALWAPMEPRTGSRLRLNAFCGLNLAAHALGRRDRQFGWLYADPDSPGVDAAVADLLSGARAAVVPASAPAPAGSIRSMTI